MWEAIGEPNDPQALTIRADCMEILPTLRNNSIDMVLCDMPYGTTRNKWDSVLPLDQLFSEYERITTENAAILLFSQQPFTSELVQAEKRLFRYEIIWQKPNATGFLNAQRMPLKAHENILVFYKHLPEYHPIKRYGFAPAKALRKHEGSTNYRKFNKDSVYISDGSRYPIDVLIFKHERGLHPTQKPTPLCEYLIKTYTSEGATVLDNCMGSGTTGVAAIECKRRFLGIELDQKYYETARSRINEAVNKPRLLVV